jgi:hypothetical protein
MNDQEKRPGSGTGQLKEQVFPPPCDGGKAAACEERRIQVA